MRRNPYPALPFALVLGLTFVGPGCGSSTTTDVTAPTSLGRCQATVQGNPTSFGPAGGTGNLSISLSRECAWSATSTAAWIELTSGREGQGEGSVGYRVHANADPVSRRGAISVGERRVDLAQEAAPCRFDLSLSSDTFTADGGQARVDVSTHPACRWTAATSASWITLAPPAGTGPGTLQISASVNPGATRAATVVIAGEPIVLTQAARGAAPPAPPPAPNPPGPPPAPPPPPIPGQCTFAIAPGEAGFTFAGGAGSFVLTTSASCAWTVTSNASWIVVTSPASGSGTAEIRYMVQPNTSPASREGAISAGGSGHRVVQSGVAGTEVEVDGVVSGLTGTCPALRFSVNGSIVTTNSQTSFRRGNCSHMVNGIGVEVTGRRQPDDSILASVVSLDR